MILEQLSFIFILIVLTYLCLNALNTKNKVES